MLIMQIKRTTHSLVSPPVRSPPAPRRLIRPAVMSPLLPTVAIPIMALPVSPDMSIPNKSSGTAFFLGTSGRGARQHGWARGYSRSR